MMQGRHSTSRMMICCLCVLLLIAGAGVAQQHGLSGLLKQLDAPDATVRMQAAQQLGKSKNAGAVEPLLTRLNAEAHPLVRARIIAALGELGDARAVDALIAVLADEYSLVSAQAATALGKLKDPRVLNTLLTTVQDARPDVRVRAVMALGALGADARVIPPLLTALTDPDPAVRREAAAVLGTLRAPEALDPLLARLADEDGTVRLAALQALGRFTDPRVVLAVDAALRDADPGIRRVAVQMLQPQQSPRAVDQLLAALNDTDSGVRLAALQGLAGVPDARVAPELARAIQDPDPAVRRLIIDALGKSKATGAILPLVTALADADKDNRQLAARLLMPFRSQMLPSALAEQALPALAVAVVDADPLVRESTIDLFRRVAGLSMDTAVREQAAPPLLRALDSPDRNVHIAAVQCLGELRLPQTIDPLVALLQKSTDAGERISILYTLAQVYDRKLIPVYTNLLKAGNGEVSEQAGQALARYGRTGVDILLGQAKNPNISVRQSVIKGLRATGDRRAIPMLVAALQDPQQPIRIEAAIALGFLGDARAVPPLLNIMKSRLRSAGEITTPLTCVNDPQAVEPLLAALKTPNAPYTTPVLMTLGHLRDPRAVPALLDVVKHHVQVGDITRMIDESSISYNVGRNDPREYPLRAVIALGEIGTPALAPTLPLLTDKRPAVRAAGCAILQRLRDTRALPALHQAMRDPDPTVRKAAVAAVASLGEVTALPALLAALKEESPQLRKEACRGVGELCDTRAVEPLLKLAALPKLDPISRRAVTEALADIGDPRAYEVLVAATRRPENEINEVAIRGLGRLKDPRAYEVLLALVEGGKAPAPENELRRNWQTARRRMTAAEALANLGDRRAIPVLLTLLQEQGDYETWRLVRLLNNMDDPQVQAALHAYYLQFFRRSAGYLYSGGLKEKRDLAALLADLQAPHIDRQRSAVHALIIRLKADPAAAPAAVPPLLALLTAEQDPVLRAGAIIALGTTRDPRALTPLLAILADPKDSHRAPAAAALGLLGDRRAADRLLATLKDSDVLLRVQAVRALGQVKEPRAVAPLLALLPDRALDRLPGMRNIYGFGIVNTGLLPESGFTLRDAAACSLGEIGDVRAVPALLTALKDENAILRARAAEALGTLKDPRAVPALITALQDPKLSITELYDVQPRPGVREQAAKALATLGDPRAVPSLIAGLERGDWRSRRAAAEALGQMKDARAVGPLIAALEHAGSSLCPTVITALQQITGQDFGTDVAKWKKWSVTR